MTVLLPSNLRGFNEFSFSRYLIERINYPVGTGRKLNVHKTFRRRPGSNFQKLNPEKAFFITRDFPENLIEIWRFFSSTLSIFIDFSDFLTFPCYLETNSLYQTLTIPSQIFFCEFFESIMNTFFTEHLRTTTSDFNSIFLLLYEVFVSEEINICLIFRVILEVEWGWVCITASGNILAIFYIVN